ncbi:MAG: FAD-binding oxidoreductase [Candidatus Bathyarchaeota archaeon]|nr:FAD-binding oxidoreductase [Candidatus Bathyarchaeota archaeon]MDH5494464.1 FAD-binding oxidoreductase [Candidatus Bathyarchaeota archaeon]
MTEYDSVIVGAGIIGLATAYHIKKQRPNDRILVIDKMSTAGQGNTAKSAAMFRCFFYSHTNLTLVDTTVEFFKHVQNQLGVDLKLKWAGYLWLFSKEHYRIIEPILRSMAENGLGYEVYEEEELTKRLNLRTKVTTDEEAQMMGLADVEKGVFVPKAGSIDIDLLVQFYKEEFQKMGGEILYNTKAEKILVEPEQPLGMPDEPFFWQKSKAAGVDTNRGTIKAKKTIIAAGVWANTLLHQVGVYAPMEPIKRQLFSVKASTTALRQLLGVRGFNVEDCVPFTILPEPAIYIKPAVDENAFWLSYGDDFPRAFKLEDDPQSEENFYRYGIYQVVTKYFPQFLGAQPYGSWAGQYALNTIDGQPVIFEENDLLVVGSCSGSGNMKGDAIGQIAAALYKGEEYTNLYGDKKFRVSDLGMAKRHVEPEKLII